MMVVCIAFRGEMWDTNTDNIRPWYSRDVRYYRALDIRMDKYLNIHKTEFISQFQLLV